MDTNFGCLKNIWFGKHVRPITGAYEAASDYDVLFADHPGKLRLAHANKEVIRKNDHRRIVEFTPYNRKLAMLRIQPA